MFLTLNVNSKYRYNPAMKIYLLRKRPKYCDCRRKKQNLYRWLTLALKMTVTTVMQSSHLRSEMHTVLLDSYLLMFYCLC